MGDIRIGLLSGSHLLIVTTCYTISFGSVDVAPPNPLFTPDNLAAIEASPLIVGFLDRFFEPPRVSIGSLPTLCTPRGARPEIGLPTNDRNSVCRSGRVEDQTDLAPAAYRARTTKVPFFMALLLFTGEVTDAPAAAQLWSSPTTWGGLLPGAGATVTIPPDAEILLDVDPPGLNGLIIKGSLVFDRRNLSLITRWILVDGGRLTVGSAGNPHMDEAVITLTGTDEAESIAAAAPRTMGTKLIGVINGGRLELHGTRGVTRNWSRLNGHALAGTSNLRVVDPIDWAAGDRLVIAPSGFDPTEAEEVTVTSVTNGLMEFTPALKHDHWGELQVIEGHEIDERAEVACLTRNIVIQGDEASEASSFGGHLMFARGAVVHIEGVEFRRMGQKGHAGRYPIHWHLAGDQRGDYARGNSIHHSYHRAVVVHGTSNVRVEGNVVYDIWSHAYVPSEDGSETGNRFADNLGMLIRRLAPEDYAFPANAPSGTSQSENRPAIFWMRNPDQTLVGNHAAGVVDGMGFMFDGPGLAAKWTGVFSRNTAHSSSGPSGTAADRYPGLTVGYGLFVEDQSVPTAIEFEGFTGYKNTLSGMWLEAPGHRARGAVLADNGTGAILMQSTLEDSVIVGQTDNRIGTLPAVGTSLTGGVHLVAGDTLKAPQVRSVDFINQRDAGIVLLGTRLHPLSGLEDLRFFDTLPCRIASPAHLTGGFTDWDGCLAGDGVPAYVHGNDGLGMTSETTFNPEINAWMTPLSDLLYLSLLDTNPVADDLGFTVLARDAVASELPDTGLSGQSPERSGYLGRVGHYTITRFDPLPDGIRIAVGPGEAGSVLFELPRADATHIYEETRSVSDLPVPDFSKTLPPSSSAAEVTTGTTTSWFGDSESQTLQLRLEPGRSVFVFNQPNGGLALASPEEFWRSRQFGYFVVADPDRVSTWGSLADPDGDGVVNLREFFHGTDPLHSDDTVVFDPSSGELSFNRDPGASGLDHAVFCSSDLVTWTELPVDEEILQADGRIRVSATANGRIPTDPFFIYLKVKQNP